MIKIYIKPKADFPYLDTDVLFEKSLADIKNLLRKFKCDEILTHEAGDLIKIAFKKEGIPYIIDFPLIYIEGKKTPARLEMGISGRVVYNRLKSNLLEVEIGSLSFMQAMLRSVALLSPQGLVTLGDVVEAQKDSIIKGQISFDPGKIKLLTQLGG